MIAADAEPVRQDFRRAMPVAEMPGEVGEADTRPGQDVDDLLRCDNDADNTAILKDKAIAVGKAGRALEIEEKCQPALARHLDATALARLVIEQDRIDVIP